ncbi:NADPH-dependent FMN reductase [Devosia albogilva]|uniref:NADPH-dependent FMN reductase n=1 Tax=Devosia albogilva TaxID=429726 RepID=A0ABW5QHE0_9HYPH
MTHKPKIALIIGSTRQSRWADVPARWMLSKMKARDDFDTELVDLRDYELPFFDEAASNMWIPSKDPRALRWQDKVQSYDGYVFVVAEYNRSITAALKNALDQDYVGWNNRPMGMVAYGTTGGARAAEHLRPIAVELQMVPVRSAVHIGGSDFYRVIPNNPQMEPIEALDPILANSVKDTLGQLSWYARVLKAAREADARQAA